MAATSIDAAAGAFVVTGYAASLTLLHGYLVHRLVVTAPGFTFQPGDPDPLPDTDFWITSRRGNYHTWIAQSGEGLEAGPDISVGGQKLELPLGRATDGEVQIRLIDVAAPIASIACGMDVLVAEGDAGLDSTAYGAGGWTIHNDQANQAWPPSDWWGVNVDGPYWAGSVLFFWIDQGFPPYTLGTFARSSWIEKTFNGTESGGAAWTPGQIVGCHFRIVWGLDTGAGNIFAEMEGGAHPVTGETINRVSFPNGGYDFWTIDEALAPEVVFDGYLSGVADGSGELTVRLGGEAYSPSANVSVAFKDLEFVSCEEVIVGTDAERYITGWLADSDARQQLLGRPAYLEESLDGGATWSRVLYRGYLKQITLDQSLTYLLTLGDAGRGRRNSKAWSGLNPVEEFAA